MADNLLDKASILLTPTAYNDGRMLSVKPNENLYGSELVTNGDFSNGLTDWSVNGGSYATIVDGALNSNNTENGNWYAENISQNISFVNGKTYKVTFKAKNISGDLNLRLTQGANIIFTDNITSSFVDYEVYYTANADNSSMRIFCNDSVGQFQIDNVSVVEDLSGDFTFSRGSAATRVNAQGLVENVQIISEELVSNGNFSQIGTEEVLNGNFSQEGSELVTNGGFDTDSDWTTNDWNISGGTLNGSASTGILFQSNIGVVVGKTYKVTLGISNYTSGSIRFKVGGASYQNIASEDGVQEFYFVAATTANNILFSVQSAYTGSIDNVSVKEVGQNWTLDSGWSIGEDDAGNNVLIGNSASSDSFQLLTGLSGERSYKITFDCIVDSGEFAIRVSDNKQWISQSGNYTIYDTKNNANSIVVDGRASNPFTGSITNISVKEVGQDWTLGTGWSVDQANSRAEAIDTPFGSQLIDSTTIVSGKKYKISFDVSNYIKGSIRIGVGNVHSSDISDNGNYTFTLVAANTSPFKIETRAGGSGTTLSISNISVKEITDDTDIPRINYSGFSYQDSLGSELVVNGDFSNGSANWNLSGSNISIANGKGISTGSNFGAQFKQTILQTNKTYKLTFDIVDYTSGAIGLTANYYGEQNVFNSIGTHTANFTSLNQTELRIYSENFVGSIDNVSVKEYLGQEVVPDSGCGSWLLEPQSTNLVAYSEDFSNVYWDKSNTTVLQNQSIAPSGLNEASLVSAVGSNPRLKFNGNFGGGDFSLSWFAKKNTSSYLKIRVWNGSVNHDAVFDLDNGTLTSGNGSIKSYGNGWYRCTLNYDTAGSHFTQTYVSDTSTGSLYLWGAQLEEQSYATSYIPTNGATNTRLQDLANNSGNATLINSTEGVLYAEIAAFDDTSSLKMITLQSADNNNKVSIGYANATDRVRVIIRSNGSNIVNQNFTASNLTDFNKLAFKYESGASSIYLNGSEVLDLSSANFTFPQELSKLNFDGGNTANPFYGKTKALAVYKEAKTDANLRCLTYPPAVATTFDLDFDTIADDFTFTRGSEATFVNEQGLIQSTNQMGSELITNGDFSNGSADWILDGTNAPLIENGLLKFSFSSGTYSRARQNIGVVSAKITYTVVNSNVSTLGIREYGGANNVLAPATVGTHTVYENFVGNGFSFQSGGVEGGILEIDNVSVEEVITATNTPRIDYSTGEAAFLLEPQSTNYCRNSEQPSTWHSSGGVIVTPNATASPEGLQNSSLVVNNASSGARYSRHSFSFPSGSGLQTVTTSFFVKYYNNQWVRFRSVFFIGSPANSKATYFDIQNGVIGTSDATHIAKIEDYGNGWYRCSITFDIDKSSDSNGYTHIEAMDGDNSGTFAANGQGYYAYGSQGEEFSYPTSYIPTLSAFATRNQEICKDATPVINSEEGTLYAEISALANDGTFRVLGLDDDTSTLNNISIFYRNTENRITFRLASQGSQVIFEHFDVGDALDFHKVAFKYKSGESKIYIDGVLKNTYSTTSMPIGLKHLSFEQDGGGLSFFGNTKGLKYYPKALADVQLEDLTTI